MSVYRYALKYIISKSQQQLKKYIRQRLKDEFTDQLQLSTEVGKINKIVKDKLKEIKSNYYRTIYDWLIDQKKIPEQDVDKIIYSIKQYQVIQKNYKQCPKFSSFKKYSDLTNFIQNYKKENSSYQFQKMRNQARSSKLPFDKVFIHEGKYDAYIIKRDDWNAFNKLYGNNNESEQGGIIATTSWCVALDESYFWDYAPPYYLITDKNNNPQALLHVNSHQFKDVDDYEYTHQNKQVCQLAIQIIKHCDGDFEEDFEVLVKYMSKQDKERYIDYLIEYDVSQLRWKISNNLIGISRLDKNQTYKLIKHCIENNCPIEIKKFVEDDLLSLTDQMRNKITDELIKQQDFDILFVLIGCNVIGSLQQKVYADIIQNALDNKKYYVIASFLKYNEISDSVKASIISNVCQSGNVQFLDNILYMSNNIEFLSRKQKKECLRLFIQNGNVNAIIRTFMNWDNYCFNEQEEQWFVQQLIKKHDADLLKQMIDDFSVNQLSSQQQNMFVQYSIKDKKYYDIIKGFQKGILNKINQETVSKIIDHLLQDKTYIITFISAISIKLNDQQSSKIKQFLINELDPYMMAFINRGVLTPLTDQQQQKFFNDCVSSEFYGTLLDAIKKGFKLTEKQEERLFSFFVTDKDIITLSKFVDAGIFQFAKDRQMLLNRFIKQGLPNLDYMTNFGLVKKPTQQQYKKYMQNVNKKQNTKISKRLIKIAKHLYFAQKYILIANEIFQAENQL